MIIYRAAELEILMTDLERANQRASSAEKEMETLLQQSTSQTITIAADKVHMYTCLLCWPCGQGNRMENKSRVRGSQGERLLVGCTSLMGNTLLVASYLRSCLVSSNLYYHAALTMHMLNACRFLLTEWS